MKTTSNRRILVTGLFAIAFFFVTSAAAFGSWNAYLQIKDEKGKTYKAKPDANGKFSFGEVQPGKYKLYVVGSEDFFAPSADGKKGTIEISSFSWGMNQHQGTMGSGSTGRQGSTPSVSEVVVTKTMDNASTSLKSPITVNLSNPTKEGDLYCTIVMQDIFVDAVCSPSGTVKGNWNLKENVK
ncbi:MAG: type VI secretion system tube protein Hcp [bacterium]